MRLIIHYESSWRNSFLKGSNNEPLPRYGRNFISSMKELKKEGNFIARTITQDTVMGILNRLLGDQRKLYQSRVAKDYYFKDLEDKIAFKEVVSEKNISHELIYIRNITGNTDQNSFTGAVKDNDPVFNSDYSVELWGVLALNLENLLQFILNKGYQVTAHMILDPLSVIKKLRELNSLKPVAVEANVKECLILLKATFLEVDYKLTSKDEIIPISLYTSALYLQLERLKRKYDISTALTKSGGLSGISKRGFTEKDFMGRYTTGPKKLIFGNPYLLKVKKKGEGEVSSMLTKANGKLEITIDVPYEKAKEIKTAIENAGVSSFYIGKKGLAWLDYEKISLSEAA